MIRFLCSNYRQHMRLTNGMALRDGGTTSITVAQGIFSRVSYTIDYALPWDGRTRYVYKGDPFAKKESQRLEIEGEDEVRLQRWLVETLNHKFGEILVQDFLANRVENPGNGKWLYALNFLRIMTKERSGHVQNTG